VAAEENHVNSGGHPGDGADARYAQRENPLPDEGNYPAIPREITVKGQAADPGTPQILEYRDK
jgi:hypothetical protein